jgi:carbonic anhydrase
LDISFRILQFQIKAVLIVIFNHKSIQADRVVVMEKKRRTEFPIDSLQKRLEFIKFHFHSISEKELQHVNVTILQRFEECQHNNKDYFFHQL